MFLLNRWFIQLNILAFISFHRKRLYKLASSSNILLQLQRVVYTPPRNFPLPNPRQPRYLVGHGLLLRHSVPD